VLALQPELDSAGAALGVAVVGGVVVAGGGVGAGSVVAGGGVGVGSVVAGGVGAGSVVVGGAAPSRQPICVHTEAPFERHTCV
jgi:hypothetical protein